MKKELIILLLLAAGLLSSCSGSKEEPIIEPEIVEEDLTTPEAKPRQALFVYKEQQEQDAGEIELKLNAAPLLLGSSYVRLAGVVSGGRPRALIELGGRGLVAGIGDQVLGYRVVWIGSGLVKLAKEESR